MTKPAAGEVFRYPFLWKREQLTGQTEGRKTRPVCIAVTVAKSDSETVVFILPITTQPPLASRKSVARGLPVFLGGGIKGAINDHSASVISLAYLPPFRSCWRRVSSV